MASPQRTSRRRVFAQGYAALMALAMLAPVLSPTWAGMLVFAGSAASPWAATPSSTSL